MQRYSMLAEFWDAFTVLGKRVHTVLCETCVPTGTTQTIEYDGTERDGAGVVHCSFMYGGPRHYKFTVDDGILRMCSRSVNMRHPTRMSLSGGRWSTYDNEPCLT